MNDLAGIRYGAEITSAAQRYGLDPALLAGVAAQETGGPGASSGSNIVGDGGHGHGLFQIDDRTWAFAKTPAAMDPASNANAAARILSANLTRYGGNVKAALSAYNAGSPTATGTSTTWSDGKTLGYADSVLRHVSELGGSAGQLAAEAPYTSASVNALANYSAAVPSGVSGASGSAGASGTTPILVSAPTSASASASASSLDTVDLESMLSQASASSSPSSSSSSSQFTAVRTWASMTSGQSGSGGGQAGNAADQGMADILDQENVFGDDATSDA